MQKPPSAINFKKVNYVRILTEKKVYEQNIDVHKKSYVQNRNPGPDTSFYGWVTNDRRRLARVCNVMQNIEALILVLVLIREVVLQKNRMCRIGTQGPIQAFMARSQKVDED